MMIKISIVEVDKSVILFLAIDMSSSEVVGKCAFKVRKNNSIRYQDAFIEKINRGKGIYKQLFNTREKYVQENYPNFIIESYCNKSTLHYFKSNGFSIKTKLYLVEKNNHISQNLKVV
tara:strand:+ start:396 stop:749 length:354 start_codon:yes stop_codon:yes gene_type:complete